MTDQPTAGVALKPSESELSEVALEIRDLLGRKRLTTQHYEMAAAVIGAYERVRHEPRATRTPASGAVEAAARLKTLTAGWTRDGAAKASAVMLVKTADVLDVLAALTSEPTQTIPYDQGYLASPTTPSFAAPQPLQGGEVTREAVARLAWPAAFTVKDPHSSAAKKAVAAAFERADNILALLSAGRGEEGGHERAWLEAEAQLSEISAAIGSTRFMDPPDGGSVTLAEQVRRMRVALEEAEASLPAGGEDEAWLDDLEKLADAATQGPWVEIESHTSVDYDNYDAEEGARLCGWADVGTADDEVPVATILDFGHDMANGEYEANIAFIAAANPATIKRLISAARKGGA